jgi:serine/threonine-protein kinase
MSDNSSRSLVPAGLSGQQIAGFQLEQEIGHGGMAVVYRAQDLALGRVVAVKLLAPELARNEAFRQRFASESRAAAAIDHPHIIPVFAAGESGGVLYIAMRYVEGRDLRWLLDRQGTLPVPQAVRITTQIASALDAAHAHGLVHRDVKPGNVLVAEGTDSEHPEHVYLTDFGLTKKSSSLTGFTTVGQFVGTVDYVAPEQISGRPVDGRGDLYSLACLVFELLTGSAPYQRDDDLALLWAHLHDSPPMVTEARPGLPPPLDAVLVRALAKDPDDRYSTCMDFAMALRGASVPVALHPATQVAAAPPEPAPVAAPPEPAPVAEPPEPLVGRQAEVAGVVRPAGPPKTSAVTSAPAGPVESAEPAEPDAEEPVPPLPPSWAMPVFAAAVRRTR